MATGSMLVNYDAWKTSPCDQSFLSPRKERPYPPAHLPCDRRSFDRERALVQGAPGGGASRDVKEVVYSASRFVFRGIFEPELGAPALVEHHSSIRPEHDTMANRLATENWDAPLIVTTQVQLLESLFGARPRDCRKLHNLANSVIVLDEVQTLPVGLLAPILDQLQALTAHYGVSLLLTTATQPALHSRRLGTGVFPGLDPMPREIVPANVSDDLFETLRRVRVHWPESKEPVGWDELADRLVQHPQALAIVHRRDDAAQLWRALEAGVSGASIHLSALMTEQIGSPLARGRGLKHSRV